MLIRTKTNLTSELMTTAHFSDNPLFQSHPSHRGMVLKISSEMEVAPRCKLLKLLLLFTLFTMFRLLTLLTLLTLI